MRTRASLLLASVLSLGGLTVAAAAVPAQASTRPAAASIAIAQRVPSGQHTVAVWRAFSSSQKRDGARSDAEISCAWEVTAPFKSGGYEEVTSAIICTAPMTSLGTLDDLVRNGKLVSQGDSFNKGKQGVAETVKYKCGTTKGTFVGSQVGTATFPPGFEPSPQTKVVTGTAATRTC